jgi:hypothetical protein
MPNYKVNIAGVRKARELAKAKKYELRELLGS